MTVEDIQAALAAAGLPGATVNAHTNIFTVLVDERCVAVILPGEHPSAVAETARKATAEVRSRLDVHAAALGRPSARDVLESLVYIAEEADPACRMSGAMALAERLGAVS